MGIDIDPKDLCPACRSEHEAFEADAGKSMPVQEALCCEVCKAKFFGNTKSEIEPVSPAGGEKAMKKGKRKYTRRTVGGGAIEMASGKKPKLDRETKKFIKGVLRQGKKADKLEAKAEKWEAKAKVAREEAAGLRAGLQALKDAVQVS